MACLYKRRKQYWASYYLNGCQVQKSLHTDNERVARDKLRKLEYELSIGDLPQASRLPLPALLETFCGHMRAKQTYKSYRKDVGLDVVRRDPQGLGTQVMRLTKRPEPIEL